MVSVVEFLCPDKLICQLIAFANANLLNYRFNRQEIQTILPFLALDVIAFPFRIQRSPDTAFLIVLVHLSWPRTGRDLESFFSRSQSWISRVFNCSLQHTFEVYTTRMEQI